MAKHSGVITSWISGRGFGFITEDGQNEGVLREKFYCHISRFVKGSSPAIGAHVLFNILPVQEGTKRSAIDVEILLTNDGGAL